MKREVAKYITVLDFEVGRVFQYKIEDWDVDNESCEDFITKNSFTAKDVIVGLSVKRKLKKVMINI